MFARMHQQAGLCDVCRRYPRTYPVSYTISRCGARRGSRLTRIATRASSSSVFDLLAPQYAEMERQFISAQTRMDRDIDAALNKARAAEQQAEAELQRAMTGSQRVYYTTDMNSGQNINIQRQEERGPGVYRYYERIQITEAAGPSGTNRGAYISQPLPTASSVVAPVSPSFNPVVVGSVVLLGSFLTLTAAFNRNYQLTNYAESKRWLLLALWPLLFLFSAKFREQFSAAIKGERVGLRGKSPAAGSSGDSANSEL